MSKITFYRENTVNINLAFTDVDLTGATVYFTVKTVPDADVTDSTAVITKDITSHTDAAAGLTTIALTPTDTDVTPGDYGYDIKLKKASGEQSTITVGKCEIKDVYTMRG
jgi:hypothetical protein